MPWTTLPIAGLSLLLCYLYYVAHTVVLHNCAHYSMFRSRRLNKVVGNIICSTQLMHFDGWRTAHMLHHRFANTPTDPHYVDRPLIPYLLTHYLRIAAMLGSPLRLAKSIAPTLFIVSAVIAWQAANGHWLRGLAWVGAFWAIPVLFSQILVAHFNYVTHAGLPAGRGADTRNLTHGIWPLVNWLTFNLYLHREHHLRPSQPIPRLSDSSQAGGQKKTAPAGNEIRAAGQGGEPTLPPRRRASARQSAPQGKAA